MTPEQEERLVAAFERLASAAESLVPPTVGISDSVRGIVDSADLLAMTADAWLDKDHPEKPAPRPMEVTRVKTEEDLIREGLGGEDAREPLNRWTTLGPREASWETTQGSKDAGDGAAGTERRGPDKVPD